MSAGFVMLLSHKTSKFLLAIFKRGGRVRVGYGSQRSHASQGNKISQSKWKQDEITQPQEGAKSKLLMKFWAHIVIDNILLGDRV